MRRDPRAPVPVKIGSRVFLLRPDIAGQAETLAESGFVTAATDLAVKHHQGPRVHLPRDLNAQGIVTDDA